MGASPRVRKTPDGMRRAARIDIPQIRKLTSLSASENCGAAKPVQKNRCYFGSLLKRSFISESSLGPSSSACISRLPDSRNASRRNRSWESNRLQDLQTSLCALSAARSYHRSGRSSASEVNCDACSHSIVRIRIILRHSSIAHSVFRKPMEI